MYVLPYDYGMSGTQGALTGSESCTTVGVIGVKFYVISTTDGDGNTATIDAGSYSNPAADYCASLTAFGYSDWYLPAIDELVIIQNNYVAIGGFSSSEGDDRYYSLQNGSASYAISSFTSSPGVSLTTKTSAQFVRCARK